MKIRSYQMWKVQPRWLFLKIETDEGVAGWGEPVIEGRADTVRTAVDELMGQLIGKDAMNIEDHWQQMYRSGFYRGGPEVMSAIAGIDQALWDIKGRVLGAPIYQLLGGACRERLRVYRWIGGDRPSDIREQALLAHEQGYTALKMNGTEELHYIDNFKKVQAVCDRVAAIRDALGFDMDIAVDFHGRVHKSMAKVLARELDAFKLMFIEEPVLSEHIEALREIARYTPPPIATGERMFSRWDFKRLLADGYVDIIQPDLSHAGGISEVKKIASMAEAYDVAVAPHCPLGPVALAACVQIDCCTPNVFIQEQSLGIHYNQGGDLLDYIQDASIFTYKDGFIELPTGKGLCVDPDEAVLERASKEEHNWKNPIWRNFDGTIAEW